MQLFALDQRNYTLQDQIITITESRMTHQCLRVLRMKTGDQCMVQYVSEVSPDQITRSLITLERLTTNEIKAKILSSDNRRHPTSKLYVCIALPNKFEKLELIVQKLTELQV